MAFGPDHFLKPTPKWAKTLFNIFFYTTSIVTSVLDIFTEIPPDIKLVITASVLKANLLLRAVTKCFGIPESELTPNNN